MGTLISQLAAEQLRQRRAAKVPSLAEFIREYCYGRDEQSGTVFRAFEWPSQVKLRETFEGNRLTIGLKAAGVGWTWELAWISLWVMAHPNRQVVMLAHRMDNAVHWLTRRVEFARLKLMEGRFPYPEPKKPPTQSELVLANGSECLVFPGRPDATRMHHPALIIIDEWAQLSEPVLAAILGRTRGVAQVVGISTAYGDCACARCSKDGKGPLMATNEFAHVYRDSRDFEGAESHFTRVFAPWMDCPDYAVRPSAGSRVMTEQEYPEDEREAFVRTFGGEPVYPEFVHDLHVAKQGLRLIPDIPVIAGWDVGSDTRSPAVVFMQFGKDGQLRVLHPSIQEAGPSITVLGRRVQAAIGNYFAGHEVLHYGDPSGANKSATDNFSPFDILRREFGYFVRPSTQNPAVRRESVASYMVKLTGEGQPGLQVDPREENLIAGFMGGYQRSADEGLRPMKNAYSHRQDCIQYVCAKLGQHRGPRMGTYEVEHRHAVNAHTGY